MTIRSRALTGLTVLATLATLTALIGAILSTHAALASAATTYDKVMVIAEENEPESAIIGSSQAPYINSLARTYGQPTNMQAGYPTECPSLAAYILITSGDRHGICDDKNPSAHQLSGNNIFQQVADSGKQWREYAESMSGNCRPTNGSVGGYLVRHAPPPYYTSEATRCASWDVPLGTTSAGALHSAVAAGLPAYSFVTPNACNDMHGATGCMSARVKRGDNWLAGWLPQIMAGSDFQSSRLLIVVTWDEGTKASNHIPTLVIGKGIKPTRSAVAFTHCSTLRTTEELLGLPLLGCAATAPSFRTAFGF